VGDLNIPVAIDIAGTTPSKSSTEEFIEPLCKQCMGSTSSWHSIEHTIPPHITVWLGSGYQLLKGSFLKWNTMTRVIATHHILQNLLCLVLILKRRQVTWRL